MVVNCEVKFDNNPNAIYFAGQTLSGVVELTIDKPKKVRSLILKIEGFAKVQWSETEHHHRHGHHGHHGNHGVHNNHHHNHTRTIFYSGREDYMSSISYLIGSPNGEQIELSPGQYRYNFQAILPPHLPTSCEAQHGSIRYLANVVLDRPFKFDLTYKVAFTVIKQLDLNYENPTLSVPMKMETSKTFYFWLCKTKPVFVSASIPYSGYVPGQYIHVFIDINNESRVDIEDVKVTLKKFIRYNSQMPRMKTKEEIITESEIRCGGLKKGQKVNYNQRLPIPPIPPTNANYCRVLNVSYEVQIKCKVSTLSNSPLIRLPIVIGTVPLNFTNFAFNNSLTQQQVIASAPNATPQPIGIVNYDAMFGTTPMPQDSRNPLDPAAPPPSYSEAVYQQANCSAIELNEIGEHTMGNKPFHPMYPVYGFQNYQPIENGDNSNNSNSNYI